MTQYRYGKVVSPIESEAIRNAERKAHQPNKSKFGDFLKQAGSLGAGLLIVFVIKECNAVQRNINMHKGRLIEKCRAYNYPSKGVELWPGEFRSCEGVDTWVKRP